MKLLAAPVAVLVTVLMAFPVLFATGDPPLLAGCGYSGDLDAVLATIRSLESGGDYDAQARGSTASGAYQFVDATWAGYGGFPHARDASPDVQDAKAIEHVQQILHRHGGDIATVPVVWYLGHLPPAGSAEWDTVPVPGAGNTLTPRQYQTKWLDEYERHTGGQSTSKVGIGATTAARCRVGTPIPPLADGYAYPGPPELFATARVDEPHHDYPAWDWMIPEGTPIYAIASGRVVTVQHWPHNWWDHGCGRNPNGCNTCGIGVTIEDDTGTHWAYCHGSAVHVHEGDTITAGTQVLTSGNTGRSSGPHLHLQITTADGQLRCPQPLLRSLRDHAAGIEPTMLPTRGCVFS